MVSFIVWVLFFMNINYAFGNSTDLCAGVKCIPKCCPIGKYASKKTCVDYHGALNFSDVPVYREDLTETGKSAADLFVFDPDKFSNVEFKTFAFDLSSSGLFNMYLIEDGLLKYEFPNDFKRWKKLDQQHFCMDYGSSKKSIEITPRFWIKFEEDAPPGPTSNWFLTGAFIVSSVFLILVLVVYCLLPELRNLCGMILMAYVTSLLFSFVLFAIIQMRRHEEITCKRLTFSIYFCILASFCWMSVMSFDIWWTFRGYAKARPIHRRGELFKFLMYCIYAFGLPLAMTIALVDINSRDMRHWPWFITPKIPLKGCFMEGGEKLLYFYVPMLILIVCNWVFFMMTTFNIWRLSRGTAVLDSAAAGTPAAHRTHMYRFMVYLKLSVVMGLNWVLEIISFVFPDFKVWNISDLYNILIGISIFLIFVCKKKIFKKLSKLLGGFKQLSWAPSGNSQSSSTSESSQETSLPICVNPRGPCYTDKMRTLSIHESEQMKINTKRL